MRGVTRPARTMAAAGLLTWLLLLPVACADRPRFSAHALRPPTADQRVLFIGNSLTAGNDLPAMVQALGAAAGGNRVTTRAIVKGDYSLEDHWQEGRAQRVIAEGGWSVVVLQQWPSALPESFVLLRDYTRRFNDLIVRAGARTALYMVWPSRARFGDFDGVSRSYARAAQDVHGLLLPAGDAWRAAWRRDRTLRLYGEDQFHPSAAGSWLAALVIFSQITGRSPLGLTERATPPSRLGLTAVEARLLEEVALAMKNQATHPSNNR